MNAKAFAKFAKRINVKLSLNQIHQKPIGNVLLVGRTKSVTEKITEGSASGRALKTGGVPIFHRGGRV